VKTACCTSPNRISVLSRLRRVGSASATYGGSRAQLSIPRTGETTCRVAPCNRKVKEFGQAVSSRADFSLIVQVLSETSLCGGGEWASCHGKGCTPRWARVSPPSRGGLKRVPNHEPGINARIVDALAWTVANVLIMHYRRLSKAPRAQPKEEMP